jgi:hypothetical protein
MSNRSQNNQEAGLAASASKRSRLRRAGVSVLLTVGSFLFALTLAEVFLRWVVHVPGDTSTKSAAPKSAVPPARSAIENAARYVNSAPLPESVDTHWFMDDPPALPNRGTVPPEVQRRFDDYTKRGIYAPQSSYVWNLEFVRSQTCVAKSKIFASYPDSIDVFDPIGKSPYPRFRFLPGITHPSGLVANSFGFRGPEIVLRKPPRTIRIAFVGASATVDTHSYNASYPEWTAHWLNRWSQSRHWDVRFEVLNAGREGIGSSDIAAIVQQEVVPLDPDLILYMEGGNQFYANAMVSSRTPRQAITDPSLYLEHSRRVLVWLREHFALARLVDRVFSVRVAMLDEPVKPKHQLVWPDHSGGSSVDVNGQSLPLDLTTIRADLDAIGNAVHPLGGQVAISSFLWLAEPGLRLSPDRHKYIFQQLNTGLWPLTYAEIKLIANYQNQFFRKYAESRGDYFIDLAGRMPRDPDLFSDAVHMTEAGVRLQGWITFALLAPTVESKIKSGEWPRPARKDLPPPPALTHYTAKIPCKV